jgi:hypothetical protein
MRPSERLSRISQLGEGRPSPSAPSQKRVNEGRS